MWQTRRANLRLERLAAMPQASSHERKRGSQEANYQADRQGGRDEGWAKKEPRRKLV